MKICRCLCVASACLLLPPAAPAAPPAFHDAVLADAPLLHYRLGETAGDAVNYGALGAAYDAAYLGTPARGAATLAGDGGVAFDGADDYLESNAVTPAALGGNPAFTAEAVVFIPAGGSALNWAPFLHWGDSSGSSAQNTGKSVYFSVSRNLPHRYYAGFYNGGLRTVGTVAQGVWHHVVWVREAGGTDQAGTTLYIDGVPFALEADANLCCNGTTPNVVATTAFRINRAEDFTRFFTGTLDEVAL